jgi:hypothetical protein
VLRGNLPRSVWNNRRLFCAGLFRSSLEDRPAGSLVIAPRPLAYASGTVSFRVQGRHPDGRWIRVNYSDQRAAACRRLELDREAGDQLATLPVEAPAMTSLTPARLRLCEAALDRLGKLGAKDSDLLDAILFWSKAGRARQALACPLLDDAASQFIKWLETAEFQHCAVLDFLRSRIRAFGNSPLATMRIDAISFEDVLDYLTGLPLSSRSRENFQKAVSRIFAWTAEPGRRWTAHNPVRDLPRRQNGRDHTPSILSVDECERLLRASESQRNRECAAAVAVAIFVGLRPFELLRLCWESIDLKAATLRVEGSTSKTASSLSLAAIGALVWTKPWSR